MQFLSCGKLVSPKHFNELELLQTEANFSQIEDLASAVEHHKRVVDEERERDEVHVLLVCILHYSAAWNQPFTEVRLFKNSKDTGFNSVAHSSVYLSRKENSIRSCLQSDCWVMKECKTLKYVGR